MTDLHTLDVAGLTLGYEDKDIVKAVSTRIPTGKITAIIGANASGKSTLLRGVARLLKPRAGSVVLDGKAVHDMRSLDVAKIIGLLPQSPVAPESITVGDLVSRGRYPHQGWFARWSAEDDKAVADALESTGTAELVDRKLTQLSGGQRQRVWIAMALAQGTDILLLDEPTTYLDINYQVEVLDLLTDLNNRTGTTIVMVLHELNLACRYADHVIAMKQGAIVTEGDPCEVITSEVVEDVFKLQCDVMPCPRSGTPMVIPLGRHRVAAVAGA
ncbi:ABC transporter ATP-binding protein [Phytomonospora endophytica]|uniref:Iron complex transport system ATP-binding protein n=1 Tax=Phytomonospora endophytica TaxID=714109 RepID=A0A841FEB7_9ACTN|nr:ABC transporter ATP-binding protein [Phytomonospora endophytica]MBB6034174.1 iron complex transport system ATP-binding protein [Phytomonospora endophytica]GIG66566.1 cobalamin/Fe3+-siderophore ABC transporter ATP-binding protein [Phytomonospora endophytica]